MPPFYPEIYFENRSNPAGPNVAGTLRVIRGGDWNDFNEALRSAQRYTIRPTERFDQQGFRVALAWAPSLSLTISGGQIELIWISDTDRLVLQEHTSLAVGSPWQPNTNTVEISGDERRVRITPNGQSRFYRLNLKP